MENGKSKKGWGEEKGRVKGRGRKNGKKNANRVVEAEMGEVEEVGEQVYRGQIQTFSLSLVIWRLPCTAVGCHVEGAAAAVVAVDVSTFHRSGACVYPFSSVSGGQRTWSGHGRPDVLEGRHEGDGLYR